MATTAKEKSAAAKAAAKPGKTNGSREQAARKRQAAVVNRLLKIFEEKVKAKDLKATLSDFMRLLQLQKELEEEQPREITVTWVEPEEERFSES